MKTKLHMPMVLNNTLTFKSFEVIDQPSKEKYSKLTLKYDVFFDLELFHGVLLDQDGDLISENIDKSFYSFNDDQLLIVINKRSNIIKIYTYSIQRIFIL